MPRPTLHHVTCLVNPWTDEGGCPRLVVKPPFLRWDVGGGGFEHGKDEVAATSGEADDRSVVFLPLGSLLLVVGLGGWVVL